MSFGINALSVVLPSWIADNLVWWIAGIIIIGGMLIFGRNEVARLQFRRVWAISGVCFAESLRRKVLWITPLGILGVIAVSLLQHPVDQQEAIRQTIKFCLFASGTLVTLTAIILACTNLPREIENRVIYTIVTKPTTRLEIVLGKVLGFVRVSGLIVVIMGLFTFAFLEWQNVQLGWQIDRMLSTESDPASRRILQSYKEAGLLNTQSLEQPEDFEIYNHFPNNEGPQWISGGLGFLYLTPFEPTRQDQVLLGGAAEEPPRAIALAINTMRLKRNVPTKDELGQIENRQLPMEGAIFGPTLEGQAAQGKPTPQLTVELLDQQRNVIVPAKEIAGGKPTSAPPESKQNPDGTYSIATLLPPEAVRQILNNRRVYVAVTPETPSVEYEVTATPTVLFVQDATGAQHVIKAVGPPRFISHVGRYGMQINGSTDGTGSVASFRFDNAELPAASGGSVDFRFRGGITRGGDYDSSQTWSQVAFKIYNRRTKSTSPPVVFHPETNRDVFVPVPVAYVAGGDFDVYVQGLDNGQWIGLTNDSVQLISAQHSFAVNLFKSLLILWLYSVLVVVVAIFTSTFLSWPIAIMLTLLILLGHWGVEQLGDALNPGVGRSVAQDLGFGRSAAQAHVISNSVDALSKALSTVSTVLPDLGKFPVMDDITRGVSIPGRNILGALAVLTYYGLPMVVLSFIILKNKEVAP